MGVFSGSGGLPRWLAEAVQSLGVQIVIVPALDRAPGLDLDVLLCTTEQPLAGSCRGLARGGVWTFCLGEPEFRRYGPPYWREVYENRDVSRLLLFRHDETFERGRLLDEFTAATVPSLHYAENAKAPLSAAAAMLARNLSRPRTPAAEYHFESVSPRRPSPWQKAAFTCRKLIRSAVRRASAHGRTYRWLIGLRRAGTEDAWREIAPPAGHTYADPFLAEQDGRHWLFFEDWDDRLNRAVLACAEVRDGTLAKPEIVLDKPYHLSYPHVFEHSGNWFMIPETSAARGVQLFRAAKFPCEWKLESVLFEGATVVDTTAVLDDGTWYFFTTTSEQPQETHLYTAARLDGPWTYHPANPVSSDIRRLRGAGAVLRRDGKLIRPSQDCSRGYGYAVRFNEIRRLTPSEYEERPDGALLPNWAPQLLGTHTYNRDSLYEVVDGLRLVRDHRG